MGRIFKGRAFTKQTKKEGLSDASLIAAVESANAGLVDARLGGEVVKLRIARKGSGKSGGYRTILAFRKDDKAFFIHFFAKNESENIAPETLVALKEYAEILLSLNDAQLKIAIEGKELEEIKSETEEAP